MADLLGLSSQVNPRWREGPTSYRAGAHKSQLAAQRGMHAPDEHCSIQIQRCQRPHVSPAAEKRSEEHAAVSWTVTD